MHQAFYRSSSCSRVFLSYLRFCSPSGLDQATMMFALDALPGSCVWSHLLILPLASPRYSPVISPLSMSRRQATPSTRVVHCLVHVASLPYLYQLASSLWSRAELRRPVFVSSFGRLSSLLSCVVRLHALAVASSRLCCLSTSFSLACGCTCLDRLENGLNQ